MKSVSVSDRAKNPQHIAIIMDGNGRWAERRGLCRQRGHEQGAKSLEEIIRYVNELGIKYLTLYAFSSENWKRPLSEVDGIMHILKRYLKSDVEELVKNDIKVNVMGELDRLSVGVRRQLYRAIKKTAHCQKMVLTLALSYSSWDEITNMVKGIAHQVSSRRLNSDSIDESLIRKHLYTDGLPDPDLLIRTGGEYRLSNFLLMQLSYSELYFCPVLWPDFRPSDLDLAIESFRGRRRRFGAIDG